MNDVKVQQMFQEYQDLKSDIRDLTDEDGQAPKGLVDRAVRLIEEIMEYVARNQT